MSIDVSNSIIKVYCKSKNRLSFHYKTDLLIPTNCTFGTSFIDNINIHFILPDGRSFNFDNIEIIDSMKYPFTDDVMALSIVCKKVIKLIDLSSSIIRIIINCNFDFSGYIEKNEITKYGILNKINNKII